MNENEAIKTSFLSIIGNLGMAVVKGVTGYFGNSYALIADAIESSSDVFSSILVLFGIKYSSKPADQNHPYGHGKAEALVTFIVVGLLISSALIIAYQSIRQINTPHELPEAYTLIVLGVVIIVKEAFYRIILNKSRQTHSFSLKADAWHHRSDAITSLAAFIGISVALILGKGYESADDWAALISSCMIVYNSYLILRPALGEVMDEHMYDEMVKEIKNLSLKVAGVQDTDKCYVRKSGMKYYVDLHIMVNADITVKEGHTIGHNVKDKLQKDMPQLGGVLVHIEPVI